MSAESVIQHALHDLPTAAIAAFLALFPIVNPFGGIPLFFSLTTSFSAEERRSTALKTSLYVVAILIVFMLFGRFVLNFFGISLPVLRIAGGLIVASTGWSMVTGSSRITREESSEAEVKEDISLTPMAMPMLSGPGSIGVVMGLAAESEGLLAYMGLILGILMIGLTVYLFLRLGGPLEKRLGPGSMGAINKIFGFLILAIAVQLIWDGAANFPR
jgi:multiple antibiotic resistance protein